MRYVTSLGSPPTTHGSVRGARILRECLEQWTGRRQTGACQTDEAGRHLNREALTSAGYRVAESFVDYQGEVTIDQLVGGIFSAMSADRLHSDRDEFAARVRAALAGREPLIEHVRVRLQFGHTAAGTSGNRGTLFNKKGQ